MSRTHPRATEFSATGSTAAKHPAEAPTVDLKADGGLTWTPPEPVVGRVVKASDKRHESPDWFDGPTAFRRAIYRGLELAAQRGFAEMVWMDPDFADWPLGERACVDLLHAWSAPQRKLVLIARNYDVVLREHARFVAWRQTWSHLVEAWECTHLAASAQQFPSVLLGTACAPSSEIERHWVMQRIDLSRQRGVALFDTLRHKALDELHQELITRSKASFPAFPLGL